MRPVHLCLCLGLLLVTSCATDGPAPITRGSAILGDPGSFLALAVDLAERVQDLSGRVSLQLRAAEEYYGLRRPTQALRLLQQIDLGLARTTNNPAVVQMRLEVARVALKNKETALAMGILNPLLKQITQAADSLDRGANLATLIQVCFLDVPTAADVLRVAVQFVYAIEDPRQRVTLLTDLAQYYTREQSGKRSHVLLEQAIPAASAISNPFAKGEAFSRVALGFKSESDPPNMLRYAQEAFDSIDGQVILNLTQNDARSIRETIINLVGVGAAAPQAQLLPKAASLIPLIPYQQDRLDSQMGLISGYLNQRIGFLAGLELRRLLESLDAPADIGLRIRYLGKAAVLFKDLNPNEARNYRNEAISLAKRSAPEITEAIRADLYQTLANAGWVDEASPLLIDITNSYTLATLFFERAEKSANQDQALLIMRRARDVALTATILRDTLVGQATIGEAKLGRLQDLVVDLPTIKEPYVLAQACIDLAHLFPADNQTPPSVLQSRQDLKARWGL